METEDTKDNIKALSLLEHIRLYLTAILPPSVMTWFNWMGSVRLSVTR